MKTNEAIIRALTSPRRGFILCALPQHAEAGIATPREGHTRPLLSAVFLYPKETRAALCRACPVMVGCIEQPLKRLARAFAGCCNSIHSTAQRLQPMGGGLPTFQRYTAMNTPAINPAAHSQTTATPNTQAHPALTTEATRLLNALGRRMKSVIGSHDVLTAFDNPSLKAAAVMVEDAAFLLETAKSLYSAMAGATATAPASQAAPDQRTTPGSQGFEPMPLESGLLLERIQAGGYSGQFLADAFLSAYRTDVMFLHSLGGLCVLDAEAFRLFHEILHIRHVQGWNDDALYQTEQQIKAIVKGGV